MSARIIDGKALARSIEMRLQRESAELVARHGVSPGLAAILVGDEPASALYVRRKSEAAGRAGIRSEVFHLSAAVPAANVRELLTQLNERPDIHGILIQQPLPPHLDPVAVNSLILSGKDADGLSPASIGLLAIGKPRFVPATPLGILELVRNAEVPIEGREVVIVGRSAIVGRPAALLFLTQHATVTVCHSRTADLPAVTRRADILVVAIGKAGLVTGAMIKPGAAVIDVGTNRLNGKLVGDVDFESAIEVASAITPVPGGVGPMTIAMLLQNTVRAARAQLEAA